MSVTDKRDEPSQAAGSPRPGRPLWSARGLRAMPRRVLAAALIGTGLVAGLAIAAVWAPGSTPAVEEARYAQFCTPVPEAAVATEADTSDHQIDVLVPGGMVPPDQDSDAHATTIARGDVVEFRIVAPIEGAASVHGLSDLVLMKAGERATLRFRAIYSGRFPLHFHGADGSHIGVWALNVSPKPS